MVQKFCVDTLNSPLLATPAALESKPRRHLEILDEGRAVGLYASGARPVLLSSLKSSVLRSSWLLGPPTIRLIEPVLIFTEQQVDDCVLINYEKTFAIWFPETGNVRQLKLSVEEPVIAMNLISFSWTDSSARRQDAFALTVVTEDGVLYFLPLCEGEEEATCYRVKFPCNRASSVRLFRRSSNVVNVATLDSDGKISIIELTPSSHPSLLGTLSLPHREAVDFLILSMDESKPIKVSAVYSNDGWEVLEYTNLSSLPKVLQRHRASSRSNQKAKFIESNVGVDILVVLVDNQVECFDVLSGLLLTLCKLQTTKFEDVCIHTTSTYRMECLGLEKSEIFPSNMISLQWISPISKTNEFDFLVAFDLLQPFAWKNRPQSSRNWSKLMKELHTDVSFPGAWQELRGLVDTINRNFNESKRTASSLVLLYLIIYGQPSRLTTFAANYAIPCSLQIEAKALVALDSGDDRSARTLLSRLDNYKGPCELKLDEISSADDLVTLLIEKELVYEAWQVIQVEHCSSDAYAGLVKAVSSTPELTVAFVNTTFSQDSIKYFCNQDLHLLLKGEPNAIRLICTILANNGHLSEAKKLCSCYPWEKSDLFEATLKSIADSKSLLLTCGVSKTDMAAWVPERSAPISKVPEKAQLKLVYRLTAQAAPLPLRPSTPTMQLARAEKIVVKSTVDSHHPKAPSRLAELVQISDASPIDSPLHGGGNSILGSPLHVSEHDDSSYKQEVETPGSTSTLKSAKTPSSTRPKAIASPETSPKLRQSATPEPTSSPIRRSARLSSPLRQAPEAIKVVEPPSTLGSRRTRALTFELDTSPSLGKVTIRRKRAKTPPPPTALPAKSSSPMGEGSFQHTQTRERRSPEKTQARTLPATSPSVYDFRDSTVEKKTPLKPSTSPVRRLGSLQGKKLFTNIETLPPIKSKRKRSRKNKAESLLTKVRNVQLDS